MKMLTPIGNKSADVKEKMRERERANKWKRKDSIFESKLPWKSIHYLFVCLFICVCLCSCWSIENKKNIVRPHYEGLFKKAIERWLEFFFLWYNLSVHAELDWIGFNSYYQQMNNGREERKKSSTTSQRARERASERANKRNATNLFIICV